jgi:hypothetical protein
MLRASALSLTCAVLALTAAACGESGSGGDDGPAALVPASASIYAEAAVQPEGELRDDALAAAGKILRTGDPAAKLRELVDKGLADDGLRGSATSLPGSARTPACGPRTSRRRSRASR